MGPELGRGDILSAPDAMALDPEGYKRHGDFYLKYYSTKMRIQGGQAPSNHPVHMLLGKQQPAPVPSSAHPVQMLLKSSPSPSTPPVPFSHGPPAHGPSTDPLPPSPPLLLLTSAKPANHHLFPKA